MHSPLSFHLRVVLTLTAIALLTGPSRSWGDDAAPESNPQNDAGQVQERAVIRDHRGNTASMPSPTLRPSTSSPVVRDHRTSPNATQPSTSTTASAITTSTASGLVGGISEPNYLYPWMVRMNGCAGVLIDPQWVLTAAHCVKPGIGWGQVGYSRTDLQTGTVRSDFRNGDRTAGQPGNPGVFMHPNYNPARDQANDIALIKLVAPFAIDTVIQTVGLPMQPRSSGIVGSLASITHNGTPPPGQVSVFRAPLPLIDQHTYMPQFIITSGAAKASLCPGDSGSGFVTVEHGRAVVRGIASQSTVSDCKTVSGEATFTDVFTHRSWILDTMKRNDTTLVGNTRVRGNGRVARGYLSVECPASGLRSGPLHVVGVEEGVMCEAGQRQTVTCSIDSIQPSGTTPTLTGITMVTTMANGTTDTRTIGTRYNNTRYHTTLPPGAVSREYTCQIGGAEPRLVMGTLFSQNAVTSRGADSKRAVEIVDDIQD